MIHSNGPRVCIQQLLSLVLTVALLLCCCRIAAADLQPATDVQLCNKNVTCEAGTQALGSNIDCTPCPIQTFKADNSSGCCKLCLPPAAVTNATNCTCPPSYYWSIGKVFNSCKRCAKNTYSASPNSFSCSVCPPGTKLNAARTGCECSAGQQATGTLSPSVVTGCTACPDGLVNPAPTTATDACKPCPENATRANAKTCLCPPATLLVKDPAGYAQACLPCPDGTVMPDLHASTTCFPCRNGAVATPDKTQCLCPPGRFADKEVNKMPPIPGFEYGVWGAIFLTKAGNWGSWTICKMCPRDEITTALNLDRMCKDCPEPLVSDDSRTLCIQLCPAGTENINNITDSVCSNCSSTSINPRPGGNCTACPPDKVASAGRTKCVCPAGSYASGSGCAKCPSTKINTVPGGSCKSCPVRLASTSGIACDICDKQYFNSALPGAAAPNCTTCAANYYQPLKSVVACTPCFGDTSTPDNNRWQLCCKSGTVYNSTGNACV